MKHFNFNDFIHHVFIDDSFILFLEKKDEFIILDEDTSAKLIKIFNGLSQDNKTIEKLSKLSIIKKSNIIQDINLYSFKQKNVEKISYSEIKTKDVNLYILLKMLIHLIKNKILLKTNNFHKILQNIRVQNNKKTDLANLRIEDINNLIQTFKLIKRIIPMKFECLDFSLCIFNLLPNSLEKKFFIGVRKYDFYAHSWIKINNFYISYNDINYSNLAVILEI